MRLARRDTVEGVRGCTDDGGVGESVVLSRGDAASSSVIVDKEVVAEGEEEGRG